eukprot:TRINITY_DN32452_c0_g1_i1.p2 TRINITY_DN32452_c0_g1~~TRINITY_DN32452_c0_g1_i1.p2  ORF type:complete len:225 (+),score=84.48 TRINITY_DN32452_c0_g1_i1:108-782(+)
MPIVCAAVARRDGLDVLNLTTNLQAESSSSFDTGVLVQQLASVAGKPNSRNTGVHESFNLFFLTTDELAWACAVESDVHKKTANDFLDSAKKYFARMYTEPVHMLREETCSEFTSVVREMMEKYSTPDAGRQAIDKINRDLDDVRETMAQNIDKVLERGEKLDFVVGQAEELEDTAVSFHKATKRVKRKMWWSHMKFKLLVAAGVVFVALLIAMMSCGPTFKDC